MSRQKEELLIGFEMRQFSVQFKRVLWSSGKTTEVKYGFTRVNKG